MGDEVKRKHLGARAELTALIQKRRMRRRNVVAKVIEHLPPIEGSHVAV